MTEPRPPQPAERTRGKDSREREAELRARAERDERERRARGPRPGHDRMRRGGWDRARAFALALLLVGLADAARAVKIDDRDVLLDNGKTLQQAINDGDFSGVAGPDALGPTQINETSTYNWTGPSTHANGIFDGIDAGNLASRTGEAKIRIASHDTSCRLLTDGVANELCRDEDGLVLWVCTPTVVGEQCDTQAEWLALGGVAKHVVEGTDFVGTVICTGDPFIGSGTQGDCMAFVTTYKGTAFVGGFLVMAGGYIAADPDAHSSYNGFKPLYGYFSPDTNFSANGSMGDLSVFMEALRTIGATHWNGNVPRTVLAAESYIGHSAEPLVFKGGTLDACNGPEIIFSDNFSGTVTNESATATITGSADLNSNAAVLLECPSCDFCGPSSETDCRDGDEKTKPGFSIGFDSAVDWRSTSKRFARVRRIVDEDTIEIEPQATGYSGTIQYANGFMASIDENTTSAAQLDVLNDPSILCPERLTIQCLGDCSSTDPWDATTPLLGGIDECNGVDDPYDCCTGNDAGTCTELGHRTVPMVGFIQRNTGASVGANVLGVDGRFSTEVAAVGENLLTQTVFHGGFYGVVNAFANSASKYKFARTGYDDTSKGDDGRHCTFWVGVPKYDIRPRGGDMHPNFYCPAGPNTGDNTIDLSKTQSVQRRVFAPRGTHNLTLIAASREETLNCGAGSPSYPVTCETTGFDALYTFGTWGFGSGYFSVIDLRLAGKTFTDQRYKRPVFEFLNQTGEFRIDVGGDYEWFNPLFSGTITGGNGAIVGDLTCRPTTGDEATGCREPNEAGVGAVDVSGLRIRDVSGELSFAEVDGRDAGAATSRSGEVSIRVARHNTDCTTLVDGKGGEWCIDQDDFRAWVCMPTVEGELCDTPTEWRSPPALFIGAYTVATLPSAAGADNRVAIVTDAATVGSCTSGGGANAAFCRDAGGAWAPLGDGALGAGGDASTNTASSIVNEFALFADTAGKLLKRSNALGTGFLFSTSGVASVVGSTGTGAVCRETSPTLATPIIGSFITAQHNHTDPANGGTISGAAIATGTVADARIDAALARDSEVLAGLQLRRTAMLDADGMRTDGTQCVPVAPVVVNGGPLEGGVRCADNAAGVLYFGVWMPDGYDGGTVTVHAAAEQLDAVTSGNDQVGFDVSCFCRGDGGTVGASWGTAQNLDLVFATQYVEEFVGTSPITCAGATPGGHCRFRAVVDTTTTDSAPGNHMLTGFKVEFTPTGAGD